MFRIIQNNRFCLPVRFVVSVVIVTFLSTIPAPYVFAQTNLPMPLPGTMVHLSNSYAPPMLTGLQVDLNQPMNMKFLIDKGQEKLTDFDREEEYTKLVKYFLSSLTIPDDHLWVNLSPYEQNRIIADDLSQTQMGLDLLAQDYMLKMITSSLMYPEDEIGEEFWERIYEKAAQKYGSTDIPVDTFNKVWIVPDEAVVYEEGDKAWVVYSHLKVMLEKDFIAYKGQNSTGKGMSYEEENDDLSLSADLVREIILPELEKEVNTGENFAVLRQIVSAMVLATWYKRTLKQSILGQVYVDQGKVSGVETGDLNSKMEIYDRYINAFKQGAFNYIKEEYDDVSQQIIPRKYFSGGFSHSSEIQTTKNPFNIDPAMLPKVIERFNGINERGIDSTEIGLAPYEGDSLISFEKRDKALLVDRPRVEERKEFYRQASPQELITSYYQSKQNMLVALNINDEKKFQHHYEELLALANSLSEKTNDIPDEDISDMIQVAHETGTEDGPIDPKLIAKEVTQEGLRIIPELIKKEFKALGKPEFNAVTKERVETIAKEIADDLAQDEDERKELEEQILADIHTYHVENFIPERTMQKDISEWRDYVASTIFELPGILGEAMGSFSPFTEDLSVHDIEDEMQLRMVLKHEIIHYLSYKKIIKLPHNWEIFTFAISAMELGRDVEPGSDKEQENFKEHSGFLEGKGAYELYKKGQELGREGKTGFLLDPSKTGNQANYLVFKHLLLEAHEIYEKLGIDTNRLKDAYSAQRTVGVILGGIFMGMLEKDPELKPMLKLRTYLETLYEYYGESSPEIKIWENELVEEAVKYVGGATGQTVNFVDGTDGVWKFFSLRDNETKVGISQLIGNRSDAKLRKYDGDSVKDIKGQKEAARERVLGHAFLAMAKQKYGFRELTYQLPEDIKENGDILMPLWDRLLLPKITKARVDLSRKSKLINPSYRPVDRFVERVLKDLYDIEDDWMAESKYLSLPLHIQYIDSLIHRWYHWGFVDEAGNKNLSLQDSRIRKPEDSLVEGAVFRSAGSLEDSMDYGWQRLLFNANSIDDKQVVEIVKNKIWPEYKKLYDIALEEETRKLAYERKIKEQGKQETAKAFDAADQQMQELIDQLMEGMPEDMKDMLKEMAKQNLDQMAGQYNEMQEQSLDDLMKPLGGEMDQGDQQGDSQQGQQGQPSPGQGQQGMPMPTPTPGEAGSGQADIGDLKETVDNLESKLDELSSEIDKVSDNLSDIKSKANEVSDAGKKLSDKDLDSQKQSTQDMKDLTEQIQKEASDLLNQGRSVAEDGQKQKGMMDGIQDGLNTPQQGQEGAEVSEELKKKAQELLQRLNELQNKANELNKGANELDDLLDVKDGEKKPDGNQVGKHIDDIENKVNDLTDQVDISKQANSEVLQDVHKLQKGVESLQKTIDQDKQAKEQSDQDGSSEEINKKLDDLSQQKDGTDGVDGSSQDQQSSSSDQEVDSGASKENDQEHDGKDAEVKSKTASEREAASPAQQIMPKEIEMPDAETTRNDVLGKKNSSNRRATSRKDRSSEARPFDIEKRRKQQEKEDYDLTGLRPEELKVYRTWERIRISHKGKTQTVNQIIDDVTFRLKELSLPTRGLLLKRNLQEGDFIDDFVKAIVGEPSEARWRKKDPLPIKFTFLMDKSGSMNADSGFTYIDENNNEKSLTRADWARITTFIMLNAIMNHNEIDRKDKNPIEFEAGVFDDVGEIIISHERVQDGDFRRERELFNLWNAMEPRGMTQYSKFFHEYVERLVASEDGRFESVRIMFVFTDEEVGDGQRDSVMASMDLAKEHKAYAFVVPMVDEAEFEDVLDVHAGHEDFVIQNLPYDLLPYRAFNKVSQAIVEGARGLGWLAKKVDANFDIDLAMLTLPADAVLERLGQDNNYYDHFFTTKIEGVEYLVFKRGNEEPVLFERGIGGTEKPRMVIPEKVNTKQNEDRIVQLLSTLYRANMPPLSAISSDENVRVHQVAGKNIQVSEKRSDGSWEEMHKFGQFDLAGEREEIDNEIVYTNKGIRWKYDSENEKLRISQANDNFIEVDNFSDAQFEQRQWIFYEQGKKKIYAYNRDTNTVLVLNKGASNWTIENQLDVPKDTRGRKWQGIVPELTGEPGTAKDTMVRAAANMLNIEIYYTTANEDMTIDGLIRGFRSLRSGTSGLDKSAFARAMNKGAWFVVDEAHKLDPDVVEGFKSHIPDKDHLIPDKVGGVDQFVAMENHPLSRMVFTSNIPRASVDGNNTAEGLAMQERIRKLPYKWDHFSSEAKWQIESALSKAKEVKNFKSEEEYAEFENDLENFITDLLETSQSLRLRFMGYDADQEQAFNKDWRLFTDQQYLVDKMIESKDSTDSKSIYNLFKDGRVNPIEKALKRPPTPRAIENIINHYVHFSKDYQHRRLSSLQLYYNFLLEYDKTDTYNSVAINRFREIMEDLEDEPLVLDEDSFKAVGNDEGEYNLVITPKESADGESYWDEVVVPISKDSYFVKSGQLPQEMMDWINFGPDNGLMFYRTMQARALDMDVILVGEPGSGKNTILEAIQRLFNADARKRKVTVTKQTIDDDLTFQKDLINGRSEFTPRDLVYGMENGDIIQMDESNQARDLENLNEISINRRVDDKRHEGRALFAKRGFQIFHTVNKIKDGFKDAFIDRHMTIGMAPLHADDLYDFLASASSTEVQEQVSFMKGVTSSDTKTTGLKLNPEIIGHPVTVEDQTIDGEPIDEEIVIDWDAGRMLDRKYTGIIGVAQEINHLQKSGKPENYVMEEGKVISTRILEKFVQSVVSDFLREESEGDTPQRIISKKFIEALSLQPRDANDQRPIEWEIKIKEIMKRNKLFSFDTNYDAIETFFPEGVVLENIKPFDFRESGDEVIDKTLRFLQTNTRGSGVAINIQKLSDRLLDVLQEKLDEEGESDWKKTSLEAKFEVINIVKLIYQVLSKTQDVMGANAKINNHNAENLQAMDEILIHIRNQYVKDFGWPIEEFEDEEMLKMDKAMLSIVRTGDNALDEIIFMVSRNFEKGREQYIDVGIKMIAEKLKPLNRTFKRAKLKELRDKLAETKLDVYSEFVAKLDEWLATLEDAKEDYGRKADIVGNRIEEIDSLVEKIKKGKVLRQDDYDSSRKDSFAALEQPMFGEIYHLPDDDAFMVLSEEIESAHGGSIINGLISYDYKGEKRFVSYGEQGKVFEYGEDGKVLGRNVDGLAKNVRKSFSRSGLNTDIKKIMEYTTASGEKRFFSFGDLQITKEYNADGEELDINEYELANGITGWNQTDVFTFFDKKSQTEMFLIFNNDGIVRAFDNKGEMASTEEENLANSIEEAHDGQAINGVMSYENKGQRRFVSYGKDGLVFEYDENGVKIEDYEDGLAKSVRKSYDEGVEIRNIVEHNYMGESRFIIHTFDKENEELTNEVNLELNIDGVVDTKDKVIVNNFVEPSVYVVSNTIEFIVKGEKRIISFHVDGRIGAFGQKMVRPKAQQKIDFRELMFGDIYGLPEGDVYRELADNISRAHENNTVKGVFAYKLGRWTRYVSFGAGAKAYEYDHNGKLLPREKRRFAASLLSAQSIARAPSGDIYEELNGFIRRVNDKGEEQLMFYGNNGFVALLDLKGNYLDEETKEMEGQIKAWGGKRDILGALKYFNTKTQSEEILIVGENELSVNITNEGRIDVNDQQGLADSVKEAHGNKRIKGIISYEYKGLKRFVSYGEGGLAFEYDENGVKLAGDKDGLAKSLRGNHDGEDIYNVFQADVNGETRYVSVGAYVNNPLIHGNGSFEFDSNAQRVSDENSLFLSKLREKHKTIVLSSIIGVDVEGGKIWLSKDQGGDEYAFGQKAITPQKTAAPVVAKRYELGDFTTDLPRDDVYRKLASSIEGDFKEKELWGIVPYTVKGKKRFLAYGDDYIIKEYDEKGYEVSEAAYVLAKNLKELHNTGMGSYLRVQGIKVIKDKKGIERFLSYGRSKAFEFTMEGEKIDGQDFVFAQNVTGWDVQGVLVYYDKSLNKDLLLLHSKDGKVMSYDMDGNEVNRTKDGLLKAIQFAHGNAIVAGVKEYLYKGQRRFISYGQDGLVFEYDENGVKLDDEADGLAKEVRERHGGKYVSDIIPFEYKGEVRYMSYGYYALTFEYDSNGIFVQELDSKLVSKIKDKEKYTVNTLVDFIDGSEKKWIYKNGYGNAYALGQEVKEVVPVKKFTPITSDLPDGDVAKVLVDEMNELHGDSRIVGVKRFVIDGEVIFISYGEHGKVFQYYSNGQRVDLDKETNALYKFGKALSAFIQNDEGTVNGVQYLEIDGRPALFVYAQGLEDSAGREAAFSLGNNGKIVGHALTGFAGNVPRAHNNKEIIDMQMHVIEGRKHYISIDVDGGVFEHLGDGTRVVDGLAESIDAWQGAENIASDFGLVDYIDQGEKYFVSYGRNKNGELKAYRYEEDGKPSFGTGDGLVSELVEADKERTIERLFNYDYLGERRVIATKKDDFRTSFEFGEDGRRLGYDEDGLWNRTWMSGAVSFDMDENSKRFIFLVKEKGAVALGIDAVDAFDQQIIDGEFYDLPDDDVYKVIIALAKKLHDNSKIMGIQRVSIDGEEGYLSFGENGRIFAYDLDGKRSWGKFNQLASAISTEFGASDTIYGFQEIMHYGEKVLIVYGSGGKAFRIYRSESQNKTHLIDDVSVSSAHVDKDIWGFKSIPMGVFISWGDGKDNIYQYGEDGQQVPINSDKFAGNLRRMHRNDPMKNLVSYMKNGKQEYLSFGSKRVYQYDAQGNILGSDTQGIHDPVAIEILNILDTLEDKEILDISTHEYNGEAVFLALIKTKFGVAKRIIDQQGNELDIETEGFASFLYHSLGATLPASFNKLIKHDINGENRFVGFNDKGPAFVFGQKSRSKKIQGTQAAGVTPVAISGVVETNLPEGESPVSGISVDAADEVVKTLMGEAKDLHGNSKILGIKKIQLKSGDIFISYGENAKVYQYDQDGKRFGSDGIGVFAENAMIDFEAQDAVYGVEQIEVDGELKTFVFGSRGIVVEHSAAEKGGWLSNPSAGFLKEVKKAHDKKAIWGIKQIDTGGFISWGADSKIYEYDENGIKVDGRKAGLGKTLRDRYRDDNEEMIGFVEYEYEGEKQVLSYSEYAFYDENKHISFGFKFEKVIPYELNGEPHFLFIGTSGEIVDFIVSDNGLIQNARESFAKDITNIIRDLVDNGLKDFEFDVFETIVDGEQKIVFTIKDGDSYVLGQKEKDDQRDLLGPLSTELPDGDAYKTFVSEMNELHGDSKIMGVERIESRNQIVFLSYGEDGKVFQYHEDGTRYEDDGMSWLSNAILDQIKDKGATIYKIKAYEYSERVSSLSDNRTSKKRIIVSASGQKVFDMTDTGGVIALNEEGLAKSSRIAHGFGKDIVDIQEHIFNGEKHYITHSEDKQAREFDLAGNDLTDGGGDLIANMKSLHSFSGVSYDGLLDYIDEGKKTYVSYGRKDDGTFEAFNYFEDGSSYKNMVDGLAKSLNIASSENALDKIFQYEYLGERRTIALSYNKGGIVYEFGEDGRRLEDNEDGLGKFLRDYVNDAGFDIGWIEGAKSFEMDGVHKRFILFGNKKQTMALGKDVKQQEAPKLLTKMETWGTLEDLEDVDDNDVFEKIRKNSKTAHGYKRVLGLDRVSIEGKDVYLTYDEEGKVFSYDENGAIEIGGSVGGLLPIEFGEAVQNAHGGSVVYGVKHMKIEGKEFIVSFGAGNKIFQYDLEGNLVTSESQKSEFVKHFENGSLTVAGIQELENGKHLVWFNNAEVFWLIDKNGKALSSTRFAGDDRIQGIVPYMNNEKKEFVVYGKKTVFRVDENWNNSSIDESGIIVDPFVRKAQELIDSLNKEEDVKILDVVPYERDGVLWFHIRLDSQLMGTFEIQEINLKGHVIDDYEGTLAEVGLFSADASDFAKIIQFELDGEKRFVGLAEKGIEFALKQKKKEIEVAQQQAETKKVWGAIEEVVGDDVYNVLLTESRKVHGDNKILDIVPLSIDGKDIFVSFDDKGEVFSYTEDGRAEVHVVDQGNKGMVYLAEGFGESIKDAHGEIPVSGIKQLSFEGKIITLSFGGVEGTLFEYDNRGNKIDVDSKFSALVLSVKKVLPVAGILGVETIEDRFVVWTTDGQVFEFDAKGKSIMHEDSKFAQVFRDAHHPELMKGVVSYKRKGKQEYLSFGEKTIFRMDKDGNNLSIDDEGNVVDPFVLEVENIQEFLGSGSKIIDVVSFEQNKEVRFFIVLHEESAGLQIMGDIDLSGKNYTKSKDSDFTEKTKSKEISKVIKHEIDDEIRFIGLSEDGPQFVLGQQSEGAEGSKPKSATKKVWGAVSDVPNDDVYETIMFVAKQLHQGERINGIEKIDIEGDESYISFGALGLVANYNEKGLSNNINVVGSGMAIQEIATSGFAKEVSDAHGESEIYGVREVILNGEKRFISFGAEGKVFEYDSKGKRVDKKEESFLVINMRVIFGDKDIKGFVEAESGYIAWGEPGVVHFDKSKGAGVNSIEFANNLNKAHENDPVRGILPYTRNGKQEFLSFGEKETYQIDASGKKLDAEGEKAASKIRELMKRVFVLSYIVNISSYEYKGEERFVFVIANDTNKDDNVLVEVSIDGEQINGRESFKMEMEKNGIDGKAQQIFIKDHNGEKRFFGILNNGESFVLGQKSEEVEDEVKDEVSVEEDLEISDERIAELLDEKRRLERLKPKLEFLAGRHGEETDIYKKLSVDASIETVVEKEFEAVEKNLGGIDLNPANMNLNIQRNNSRFFDQIDGIHLIPDNLDLQNINGFSPYIIEIVPAQLPLFLSELEGVMEESAV